MKKLNYDRALQLYVRPLYAFDIMRIDKFESLNLHIDKKYYNLCVKPFFKDDIILKASNNTNPVFVYNQTKKEYIAVIMPILVK